MIATPPAARTLLLVAALSLAGARHARAQRPADVFSIGDLAVPRGSVQSGTLVVPPGVDSGVTLPITLAHGARPGPVVAIIAGVHGSEYAGIVALQQLRPRLDPARMAGTVLLVHVANPRAVARRAVYYGPLDGKNLNRVFPGRADGTHTERLAHVLTTQVIERADVFIDLHAGESNEALRPYVAYDPEAAPDVVARSRALALAFGIDHLVAVRGRPRDPRATRYTTSTAWTRGKAAIAVESGELGLADTASVGRVARGLDAVLRHLGVVPGAPPRPMTRYTLVDSTTSVASPADGMFFARVRPDQRVVAGEVLGVLRDAYGAEVAEVRAPYAGKVMYVLAAPPVAAGETVASVGRVATASVRGGVAGRR